jgi:hypothetical protein
MLPLQAGQIVASLESGKTGLCHCRTLPPFRPARHFAPLQGTPATPARFSPLPGPRRGFFNRQTNPREVSPGATGGIWGRFLAILAGGN